MNDLLRETKSACPYCGTGCGVIVQARGDRIVGVRGDPAHPANFGKLCPKGQTLHLTATDDVIARARLLYPHLRTTRETQPRRVTWEEALDHAADRFARVLQQRGPEAVAFYVSGQLLTEDYYVFNKLARVVAGTNNIDSNSRLCMSSAVVGYKRALGADAPPCSYEDLELADCVFVAGANPAVAHPVLFGRLLEAKRKRGTRLIVADPRRTESAAAADLHLPVRPGTDLWLFTAMLGVMVRDGGPVPDVSTPEAFKKTLLDAISIVHGDPFVPNQSGVVTMRILAKAGILEAVKTKSRPAQLAEGLELVANGDVEVGLFNTVELPAGVRMAGPVPMPFADFTFYETALLAKGAIPVEATALIRRITSSNAHKAWEAAGIEGYPYRY